MQYVAGHERVITQMAKTGDRGVARMVDALEQGGVAVRNDARRNHPKLYSGRYPGEQGEAAIRAFHEATGRFTSRSRTLVRTIKAHDAVVKEDSISVDVTAGGGDAASYAEKIESKYPFMIPALVQNEQRIRKLAGDAMKGL